MKISISATNPCHLYELALELFRLDILDCYYSGYPSWKLAPPAGFPLWTSSFRTIAVYGMLKYVPQKFRPRPQDLFRWQDRAFDSAVGRELREADFIHAMPGQCLETFRAAGRSGLRTVLNHATGPVRRQLAVLSAEFKRFGLRQEEFNPFDSNYFLREKEEYDRADFHCVASNLVKMQLVEEGVNADRIWVVPYGVDKKIFFPAGQRCRDPYKIIFGGQVCLRKGIHYLLEALQSGRAREWRLDCYGLIQPEMETILTQFKPSCETQWHGAVSRRELAEAFRGASVLVLPSLEEGFGLVVAQALACGIPCIVSEGVGSRDLIRHHENGSIVPVGNAEAILEELIYWSDQSTQVRENMSWAAAALKVSELSEAGI